MTDPTRTPFPDPSDVISAALDRVTKHPRIAAMPATDVALIVYETVAETLTQVRPVFTDTIDALAAIVRERGGVTS